MTVMLHRCIHLLGDFGPLYVHLPLSHHDSLRFRSLRLVFGHSVVFALAWCFPCVGPILLLRRCMSFKSGEFSWYFFSLVLLK